MKTFTPSPELRDTCRLRQNEGIPNQAGFKLTVYLFDGTQRETAVIKDPEGLHRLNGVLIKDVRGWLPV